MFFYVRMIIFKISCLGRSLQQEQILHFVVLTYLREHFPNGTGEFKTMQKSIVREKLLKSEAEKIGFKFRNPVGSGLQLKY